jgi:hypothetical protein
MFFQSPLPANALIFRILPTSAAAGKKSANFLNLLNFAYMRGFILHIANTHIFIGRILGIPTVSFSALGDCT